MLVGWHSPIAGTLLSPGSVRGIRCVWRGAPEACTAATYARADCVTRRGVRDGAFAARTPPELLPGVAQSVVSSVAVRRSRHRRVRAIQHCRSVRAALVGVRNLLRTHRAVHPLLGGRHWDALVIMSS